MHGIAPGANFGATMTPQISTLPKDAVARWARILLDYSLEVQAGDVVGIFATPLAGDLILALHNGILERGAWPALRLTIAGQPQGFYTHMTGNTLRQITSFERAETRRITKRLVIHSAFDSHETQQVPPAILAAFMKSRAPLRKIWHKRRWVLTLYPTPTYATDAGMSLAAFQKFVIHAVCADQADPIAAWKRIAQRQAKLIDWLDGADRIRIRGEDTDLSLSVRGRKFINCRGLTNMPDGEVFTAPVETSANGWIRYSYPVCYMGSEVEDVRLKLKEGRIIKAQAVRGSTLLNAVLNMDPGARYLGEFAIATNYAVDRFIKNILFDEKIGGTVHLAAGSGGKNKSALHWDMICDLRQGGEVTVDGDVILKDGKLLV